MSYRETIRDNVKLLRLGALVAAIAIVVVPELIIGVSLNVLFRLMTGADTAAGAAADASPLFSVLVLGIPFLPLVAIALVVYQRMIMNAALYQLLLNLDENLEKISKRP